TQNSNRGRGINSHDERVGGEWRILAWSFPQAFRLMRHAAQSNLDSLHSEEAWGLGHVEE
ncbi:MAG: hypothetical protein N2C12_03335, partial [Planctomycetales bacterium]